VNLQPYIFFYGRCAEALEFYKSAFGGTYESSTVGETPMKDQFPPETHGSVMHASFTAGGVRFFCSDGDQRKTIDPDEGNVSLALAAQDDAEANRIFNALAAGGTVKMPLAPAPWQDGTKFGMVVDKFGIDWMMTSP
jgi:PhnB protein